MKGRGGCECPRLTFVTGFALGNWEESLPKINEESLLPTIPGSFAISRYTEKRETSWMKMMMNVDKNDSILNIRYRTPYG